MDDPSDPASGRLENHMKRASESQVLEACRRKKGVLDPKVKTKIACWNVLTMNEVGKTFQLIEEAKRYKLDLVGLSEVRWKETGRWKAATGETIIYSGKPDRHEYGVGLLMQKEVEKSLIKWEPIDERLLYAQFQSTYANLSIIVCYAPTEEATDEIKDEFYDKLQRKIKDIPTHDMLIVMGDINARMGSQNEGSERTMGKHGCGIINDNGIRLLSLCEENNLVIGGTLFKHKEIHKLTWESRDNRTRTQIDHIMINQKWRSSLLDVKVRRGADLYTDHNLVIGTVKIKLKNYKAQQDKRPRNLQLQNFIKSNVKKNFNIKLQNRFEILAGDDNEDVEKIWSNYNKAMMDVAKETLGYREKKHKEWITDNTIQKIKERKEVKKNVISTKSERLKNVYRERYREKNREVKRSARADKEKFLEDIAVEGERAAQIGDQGQLYKNIRKLKGGTNSQSKPVKDKEGNLLTEENATLNRWKQHFEEILNRVTPETTYTDEEIGGATEDIEIDVSTIKITELKTEIKKMKNGKAAGPDGIPAEILKNMSDKTLQYLLDMLQQIWREEKIPKSWNEGYIVKIPKKGELSLCTNWRGITLLNVIGKLMSKIILTRIKQQVEKKLRREQAGFRKDRSCIDHIFALRNILEQSMEWNSPLYLGFIDFEKAFDSLHRDTMWKIVRSYGIPAKLITLMRLQYEEVECRVIDGGNISEKFGITTGVKQGCVLAPFLFLMTLDFIMKQTTKEAQRGISWKLGMQLEDLDYADDIVFLSHRFSHMQAKIARLNEEAAKVGLKMNMQKTKIMRFNTKQTNQAQNITVNGNELDNTAEYIYLGAKITQDGDVTKEVSGRISKAASTFTMLRKIWKSRSLKERTKLKIFNTTVKSVLLYGAETWKPSNTIIHKLSVFHQRCLRRICRIFWPQKITNVNLFIRTKQRSMEEELKIKRWRWLGHVSRRENTISKEALRWTPMGKRSQQRPKNTWRRLMEKELKQQKLTWGSMVVQAADRDVWRRMVAALCSARNEEH